MGFRPSLARSPGRAFSLAWERVESLRADGLDDLLIQNWLEIEEDRNTRPYDPDWERVRVLERQGYLVSLAARDAKRNIVGYSAFHVTPDILSRRAIIASNRVIWALPEWRARVGLPMIREAEKRLAAMGCRRIEYNCKTHAIGGRLSGLLAARGYSHAESVFVRIVG